MCSSLPSAFFMSGSANTDPQACEEAQVKAALARSPVGAKLSRWVSIGKGSIAAVRRSQQNPSSVAHVRGRAQVNANLPTGPTACR